MLNNYVRLVGYVGKDVEIRHTQAGNKGVSFNLATSEFWKDKKSLAYDFFRFVSGPLLASCTIADYGNGFLLNGIK